MKFTVGKALFKETMARMNSIAEKRATIPILSNVLLVASDGKLRITATDFDMEISEVIEAQVHKPGSTTLPADTLHAITGKAMGDTISFSLGDGMVITAEKSRFTLGWLPAEDFPIFGVASDNQVTVTIASEAMRRLLERTRHAISSEETRYYLNGVMMHLHQPDDGSAPMLRGVATDGHRLARADEAASFSDADSFGQYIVPKKAISEIRKLVDKPNGDIVIVFGSSALTVESGDVTIKTKLIDGTFPDYDRVIPKQSNWQATIKTEDFRDAVDRVATIANEKSKAVKLTLKPESVTLEARSSDADMACDEVVAVFTGDGTVIGFNAIYLTEMTTCLKGEFRMRGMDSQSPVICDSAEDQSYLQVLMPMRV